MAINKFENKAVGPKNVLTKDEESAIIKLEEHCYPDYGVTIKAKDKTEADEKLFEMLDANKK